MDVSLRVSNERRTVKTCIITIEVKTRILSSSVCGLFVGGGAQSTNCVIAGVAGR